MNLKVQKRLAAQVLKCSPQRIIFSQDKLATIKEALTRADIRDLINSNIIYAAQKQSISRVRARKIKLQKSKGLRKGLGSRKGTAKARLPPKEQWMLKVRFLRTFIKELRDNNTVTVQTYRDMYRKIKGNYFRNKRHVKSYLEENKLFLVKAAK